MAAAAAAPFSNAEPFSPQRLGTKIKQLKKHRILTSTEILLLGTVVDEGFHGTYGDYSDPSKEWQNHRHLAEELGVTMRWIRRLFRNISVKFKVRGVEFPVEHLPKRGTQNRYKLTEELFWSVLYPGKEFPVRKPKPRPSVPALPAGAIEEIVKVVVGRLQPLVGGDLKGGFENGAVSGNEKRPSHSGAGRALDVARRVIRQLQNAAHGERNDGIHSGLSGSDGEGTGSRILGEFKASQIELSSHPGGSARVPGSGSATDAGAPISGEPRVPEMSRDGMDDGGAQRQQVRDELRLPEKGGLKGPPG